MVLVHDLARWTGLDGRAQVRLAVVFIHSFIFFLKLSIKMVKRKVTLF